MAQEADKKVQTAVQGFINEVDKSHMRSMERQMHLCLADCCSRSETSINDVHACKDRCEAPFQRAQSFLHSELERFQQSLSRCILSCQDDIKDKVSPSTPEADKEKYRLEFETCGIKCCDTNVGKLPNLTKRVIESLKSEQI